MNWIRNDAANYIRKARISHLLHGEIMIDEDAFDDEGDLIKHHQDQGYEVDRN